MPWDHFETTAMETYQLLVDIRSIQLYGIRKNKNLLNCANTTNRNKHTQVDLLVNTSLAFLVVVHADFRYVSHY